MRALDPVAKVSLVVVLVMLGLGATAIWQFGTAHRLATLKLGEHLVRLTIDYHYDVSHDVLCELRGPKWQHSAEIIAFVSAGESSPSFTVHHAGQVFWITADTLPKAIIYALNVETGEHWPPRESGKDGQRFLEIANGAESGYRLYQHEWIGVKR